MTDTRLPVPAPPALAPLAPVPPASASAPAPLAPSPLPPAWTRPEDLVAAGLAAPGDTADLAEIAAAFRIRVPPALQQAMTAPDDPIGRQVIPTRDELEIGPAALHDPIGDRTHAPVAGLTHRYPDRVILHLTQTCAVYCRFCFRRETVGATGHLPEDDLAAALAYVARTPAIREVILTGGDPMVLSARRIADVAARVAAIGHVDGLRLHTRIPVVAPERIDAAMIAALNRHPAPRIVLHTNHAQELTAAARAAIARLVDAGIPMLSQSVLLRGINDDAATLDALFRALSRLRVMPYYLHHCDLARGAEHFRTTIAEGRALVAALRGRIPGHMLPAYVLDIPGGFGKVPLTADHVAPDGPGHWRVTDTAGRVHAYADPERG
ncbi:lysine-2,3-aminomutase-like protein [Frigidibacter sp. MR17.24]|uniref:lysine-2,3-aminomutase-like protein n=1 Tax=Frigidibacter sp. MR17.24 TaxID=3127345 RepID=UPI003012B157